MRYTDRSSIARGKSAELFDKLQAPNRALEGQGHTVSAVKAHFKGERMDSETRNRHIIFYWHAEMGSYPHPQIRWTKNLYHGISNASIVREKGVQLDYQNNECLVGIKILP